MEIDVETTQIAAACLGIGIVILCRRQKKESRAKNLDAAISFSACSPPNMYYRGCLPVPNGL